MAFGALEKLIIIYQKSGLSMSKFAKIIGKDRRTLTSWIDKSVTKTPQAEVFESINAFFRYPSRIWEQDCKEDEFFSLLKALPQSEIKIIDRGYEGGLAYILDKESKRRFVIHPRFPSPAYRDKIVTFPYKFGLSPHAAQLRKKRYELMLEHGFESIEWYSIESLLRFAFSPIGNLYTNTQKIAVLELMLESLEDNYNKSLYLFDSYSTKIFGVDSTYISLQPQDDLMFVKMPIDSMILEITNKTLVHRIHKHFTSPSHAPKHIPKDYAPQILKLCLECITQQKDMLHFCTMIADKTPYSPLFISTLSKDLHHHFDKTAP
ncbi:hypothetical protein [Helicobacter labetoulli]|uniref:hypothetical protein n=1 Tax=Helicobacter labetoulli TaxID=2315333 RepID=UPI000EF6F52C|nr:hypothetical protein [Helicobacter labetoulli]